MHNPDLHFILPFERIVSKTDVVIGPLILSLVECALLNRRGEHPIRRSYYVLLPFSHNPIGKLTTLYQVNEFVAGFSDKYFSCAVDSARSKPYRNGFSVARCLMDMYPSITPASVSVGTSSKLRFSIE